MDPTATALGTTFGLVIGVFVLALIILWIILPFAVFGIKDKLDKLIQIEKSNSATLNNVARSLDKLANEAERSLR